MANHPRHSGVESVSEALDGLALFFTNAKIGKQCAVRTNYCRENGRECCRRYEVGPNFDCGDTPRPQMLLLPEDFGRVGATNGSPHFVRLSAKNAHERL